VSSEPTTAIAPREERVPVAIGTRGVELNSLDELYRFAKFIASSPFAPKGFSTPEAITVAIQYGYELGMTPMQSLQNVAVINGKPSIYGDAMLAVVRRSGLLEYITEHFEGSGEQRKAVCIVKRVGAPVERVTEFSVADARRAGLLGKPGPWQQYPDRMMMFRARGFALRDEFGDALAGLISVEEAMDYPAEKNVTPIRAVEDQPDDAQPPARKNAVTTEQLQQIAAEAARAGVIPDEVSAELHGMPVMELQTGNAARLLEHLRTLPAAIDADEAASAVEEPAEPAPAEELPDPFERGQTEPVPGEAERAAEQAERREAEGRAIAAMGHVTKKGRRYEVKSGRDKTYHVTKPGKHLQCDCPDFAYGGAGKPGYRCKHAWSVVYHAKGAGGTDTVGGQPISEREAADLRSAFEGRGVNAAEWLRAHGIASGLAGDATVEVFDAAMAELFN
jgi:hypothetical protein